MAKKSNGPSKSQEIREYYEANPEAKPRQVVDALAEKGIAVTAAFVSTIRSTSTKKKVRKSKGSGEKSVKGAAKGRRAVSEKLTVKRTKGGVTIEGLMKAKSFVEELGGFENVMNALNALKRLGD